MNQRRSATVNVVREARPKTPKVDRGVSFETHLRGMFKDSVQTWCKDHRDPKEQPDNEIVGQVVEDLVAHWASPIETTIDAATASFLATTEFDDDDEGTDVIGCPECNEEFELPETHADGTAVADEDHEQDVKCPKCGHEFAQELLDGDDDDGGDDPDDGERKVG